MDPATLTLVQLARVLAGADSTTFAGGDPVIVAVDDDTLDTHLQLALRHVPLESYGTDQREAQCLLALHGLSMMPAARGTSAPGAITAETRGKWSRSYAQVANLSAATAWLMASTYGARFHGLAMSRVQRAPFYVV